MRRYEFVEGSSKKFWEIELEGESFTTRWGRIGTDGQEKTQDFDSAADARKAHDKLVAEKEKKGYRLVGSDEGGEARPLTAKVPSNPALLAAVLERPDDGQAWQVFADWLLEQGEAWGEVIGAAARGRPDTARQSKVAAELLGEAEAELQWKHGVIERFVFAPTEFDAESPMEAIVERVLRHPAGHFVREVSFGLPPCDDGDIEWHMEGLAMALEKAGPLPRLETLVIFSGGLDEAAPLELGKAHLPKLTRLELYFGDENYGCTATVDSLKGLLSGKGLPALTYLGLENSMFETDLIEALAKAPLVKRLEVLDLSKGILWRAGAEALVKHAGDFEHLKRLVLEDNYLEEAHQAAIKQVLKNVEFGEQKEPDDFDGDEPYRYTTIAE